MVRSRYRTRLVVLVCTAVLAAATTGCSDLRADAEVLLAKGDLRGAEAIYSQLVANDTDDIEALDGLAVTLMLQSRYDEALPIQERVVAADPSDVRSRVELGFNYLNHQGRGEDAVRVLTEAVAISDSAKNLTFLAQAQKATGNANEAETTLRRALEVDPRYAYSYIVLVELLQNDQRYSEAAQVKDLAKQNGLSLDTAQPAR